MPETATVRVTRSFDASPERVFNGWLDPAVIRHWILAAKMGEEEVLRIAVDARVGGSFSFLIRRRGQELDHVGKYLEIDPPRHLAFTWGVAGHSQDESRVTLDFVPSGEGCDVTLTHEMDPKWADYAERVAGSWNKILDELNAAIQGLGD
jgi:uncharacterized protein YndB with AHSA1/START domain